jgi:hypothetical protein
MTFSVRIGYFYRTTFLRRVEELDLNSALRVSRWLGLGCAKREIYCDFRSCDFMRSNRGHFSENCGKTYRGLQFRLRNRPESRVNLTVFTSRA